ncbi:MAG: sigma-70 family RNA polymerase sigma factor [Clostridia bacterium]
MDTALMEEARQAVAGDKDAFVRLMLTMEQMLYRVARSMLKTDSECLDAVQEAVVCAYTSIHLLREPRFFKTWLVRILLNVCYRMLREQVKVVPFAEPFRAEAEERFESKVELQEALDSLDDDLRLAIRLHYYEGFTIREMADILQIAEGTIKSRLVKARRLLANWYAYPNGERGAVTNEG